MNVNCVILEGRLVKNAEFSVKGETKLSRFVIATDTTRKTPSGSFEKKADFFPLVVFGNYAEKLTPYLVKGRQVTITGKLVQDSYEKDGEKRSRMEIRVKEVSLGSLPASGNQTEKESPELGDYDYDAAADMGDYVEGYGES